MAANVNRVLLAGNLTRDPVVRVLAGEKAVANFGIAINHRYKTADGQQKEDVTFVDVEAWGRTAELVGQYLTKGRACFVEGRLKLDSWEDKDGGKRSKLKVVADSIQFLDSKKAVDNGDDTPPGAAPPVAQQQRAAAQRPAPAANDDEPPF